MSKAGHELREWQKEGYIQKKALKSMFLLTLNMKLNCGNIMRKQGISSEARLLVPLLNYLPSNLLTEIKMACLPSKQDKNYLSRNTPFPHYGEENKLAGARVIPNKILKIMSAESW